MEIVSVFLLSKAVRLDYLSDPQIWNIEQEEDRKRGSRLQASEAQRKKGGQRSRARDKKKQRIHFLWNNNMKIF